MSDYVSCPGCRAQTRRNKDGKYRKHAAFEGPGVGETCDFSGTVIQEDECQPESKSTATSETASSVPQPEGDAPESAPPATASTSSSPTSPDTADDAPTASAPDAIPGVESYAKELGEASATQTASYRERVEASLTPFAQPTPPDYERPTLFSHALDWCPCMEVHGKITCQGTCQPLELDNEAARSIAGLPPSAPTFSQPAGRRSEQPDVEMSTDAASIAARVKELFYAYDNRRSADNRSAQATMGPSEMGTPCDRRLALSLMRMPPVNPGGDGWAAFVGTCIHEGLEEMFLWADAGTGRFAVEQRLEFGHPIVPKGTADLLDRVLLMVLDHKCQGRWSRNKLKTSGLSPTYQVQAHVYAHGMRLRGEKIEKVAIISWPRDEATLDDLYVHVEDYNPLIVKRAFERVDSVAAEAFAKLELALVDVKDELTSKALVAGDFNVADDCRFCKYYMPGARSIATGCNGKR